MQIPDILVRTVNSIIHLHCFGLQTACSLQAEGAYIWKLAATIMTDWKLIQQDQRATCDKMKVDWTPVDINSLIAFNNSLLSDTNPINGLRYPKQELIDGWYLWSGGEINQDDNDFFKPIHVEHLLVKRPIVLKYLGLPAGWRFQIDDNGCEDVWFDKSILEV